MPLEIRELHIKVNVGQPAPEGPGAAAPAGGQAEDRDHLIAQCVEAVIAALRNRKER
jgi:hypothetical protein